MDLVVDIGNSFVKLALFEVDEIIGFERFSLSDVDLLLKFLNGKFVDRAIVASVNRKGDDLFAVLKRRFPFVFLFDETTKTPVVNLYGSPATLGADRLPPVVAAFRKFPGSDLLVIDAGTCIKFNFLNKRGEFLGGGISPGLRMRFKALHTFTSGLPLLAPDMEFEELIGVNTNGSMRSGVQQGAVTEVDGTIDLYERQFPGLKVFLTGGDLTFFEKHLKNRIFVDPYLVLRGLDFILNHNT
jgi:type III pantothenate kinase